MKDLGRLLWLGIGLVLGLLAAGWYFLPVKPVEAANDRYEDNILCTGPANVIPRIQTDGVWMLDYRSGKLLATVIDRSSGGKILGWAELDLVSEFGTAPKQNVHFLMTTGHVTQGQAALYLAETVSGKMGVYTLGPRPDGQNGVSIRRHDLVLYRQPPK